MARSYDYIVVGAGIIGASTAHYLAKKRAGRVLLLDRLDPPSGGTGGAPQSCAASTPFR